MKLTPEAMQAIRSQRYVSTDSDGRVMNRIAVPGADEYQGLVIWPNKLFQVTFQEGFDIHLRSVWTDDIAAMRRNMPLMFPEDFR